MDALNSYDTIIKVSVKEGTKNTQTFDSEDTKEIEIDNSNMLAQYPVIELEFNSSMTGDFKIVNDNLTLETEGLNIENGDVLLLDFENQIYELNSNNIIEDIILNNRFKLFENSSNTIEINCNADIEVTISYQNYSNSIDIDYVEGFNWDFNNRYREKQSFNKKETGERVLTSQNIGLSIGKISADYYFYQKAIEEDNLFRFEYTEDNRDSNYTETKYLVDVSFDRYRRGFNNPDDFIMTDITGTALKLL